VKPRNHKTTHCKPRNSHERLLLDDRRPGQSYFSTGHTVAQSIVQGKPVLEDRRPTGLLWEPLTHPAARDPIDPSLFSTDPPEGYTVETEKALGLKLE
jgi:hypothetical protein